MKARYRFQGKFISAAKAEQLSHTKDRNKISTDILEDKKHKTFKSSDRFLAGTALRTVYAMEKDRQIKEDQRRRRIERERERTREFQRHQVEGPSREPARAYDYEPPDSGGSFAPSYDDDEDDTEDYIPDLDMLPDEDFLIDDYFEDALEVADIDGDIYIEQ